MDLFGLDVLGIDAVVADVRIRESHDLPAIARVSEDFLVAGDGGVEHHFADGLAGGADRGADKDRAVCEREDGLCWDGKHGILHFGRTYAPRVTTTSNPGGVARGCRQVREVRVNHRIIA